MLLMKRLLNVINLLYLNGICMAAATHFSMGQALILPP